MSMSLIEELPRIVADSKKEVERILERASSPNRLLLQTNEYVLPSKDKSGLYRGRPTPLNESEWHNRLIYGDNLLVMQALLTGDPSTGLPSMRDTILKRAVWPVHRPREMCYVAVIGKMQIDRSLQRMAQVSTSYRAVSTH